MCSQRTASFLNLPNGNRQHRYLNLAGSNCGCQTPRREIWSIGRAEFGLTTFGKQQLWLIAVDDAFVASF